MSDTFDHESDAYDSLMDDCYWDSRDSHCYWGRNTSENYLPKIISCKYCGDSFLEWRKIGLTWMLFNDTGTPHRCNRTEKL